MHRLILWSLLALVGAPAYSQTSAPAPAGSTTSAPKSTPSAPAATESASSANDKQAAARASDNPRHGVLGPLRIGVTAALGFPHPLTYGLDVLYADVVSGGLSFGNFELDAGAVKLAVSNWDLRGRWHPFAGSFFLGAAYGNQTISAALEKDLEVGSTEIETKIKLAVDTTYLTPHLGWFAMWDSGLTLGFELGYQMALSSKAKDLEIEFGGATDPSGSDEFDKMESDVKKAAESFGKASVPYLTLLRLGWLF